ncbi:hypothetical protein FISHEDRAFT_70582 [Fistulina hepatica ATCC 64428]|uniref:HMG box domain-containing protein n=1 Tax=Fistulina hepatica ATCC 64428 TaxID=1128425 RepID=A0A0D7AJ38_9AGAR|nr:hypothetical protein FISHEDRAFT_70582 [Fistulina hepatica ATCC 64428]
MQDFGDYRICSAEGSAPFESESEWSTETSASSKGSVHHPAYEHMHHLSNNASTRSLSASSLPPGRYLRPNPIVRSDAACSINIRRRRRVATDYIPRPANSFLLFRADFLRINKTADLHQNEVSRRAGVAWRALSSEEKLPWQLRSQAVKAKHQRDHPHYRYTPNRKRRRPKPPIDGADVSQGHPSPVMTSPPIAESLSAPLLQPIVSHSGFSSSSQSSAEGIIYARPWSHSVGSLGLPSLQHSAASGVASITMASSSPSSPPPPYSAVPPSQDMRCSLISSGFPVVPWVPSTSVGASAQPQIRPLPLHFRTSTTEVISRFQYLDLGDNVNKASAVAIADQSNIDDQTPTAFSFSPVDICDRTPVAAIFPPAQTSTVAEPSAHTTFDYPIPHGFCPRSASLGDIESACSSPNAPVHSTSSSESMTLFMSEGATSSAEINFSPTDTSMSISPTSLSFGSWLSSSSTSAMINGYAMNIDGYPASGLNMGNHDFSITLNDLLRPAEDGMWSDFVRYGPESSKSS